MMKILLANPPWEKDGYFAVRAGSRWPHFEHCTVDYMPFPFFLAIATKLLEEHGYQTRLIDALAEKMTISDFTKHVENEVPDIIFFEVSTPSLENDITIARKLLDTCPKKPFFIFGGVHKPREPKTLFDQAEFLDVFIHGEYESSLLDVVNVISLQKGRLAEIPGISYRTETKIQSTEPGTILLDLDELPRPAYEQLPMLSYYDACGGLPKPSVQLWSSRGCPFGCIFCAWPQIMYGNRSYRTRNPVKIVDELEWLIDTYGFLSAYFDDDTFNIGKDRVIAIAEEIRRRKLPIVWGAMARADTMDRETLQIMVDSGLRAIKYGVESGNQEIINNAGKSLDLEKVRQTVQWTKDLNVKFHLSFAFGLPGETWKTIEETVDLALELDPTTIQFSLITPFPGSEYYYFLEKQGHLTSSAWEDFDGYTTSVVRTKELSSLDLEHALSYAEARWRRHLMKRILRDEGFRILRRAWNNPGQVKNFLKSLLVRK